MIQVQVKESILDTWYKKIILVGAIIFAFTIYLEFGFISSGILSYFGLGLILVGLGELVNHKSVMPQFLYGPMQPKLIRKPEEIGLLLDAVGIFCFAFGFYLMLANSF